jgi:hypothetical protein
MEQFGYELLSTSPNLSLLSLSSDFRKFVLKLALHYKSYHIQQQCLSHASDQHHISSHPTHGPTTHAEQCTFQKPKNTSSATNGTQEPLKEAILPGEWPKAKT